LHRLLLLISFAILGCGSATEERSTLRFAVTDVEGMEQLQVEFGAFRDLLIRETGLPIEFFAVSSRTAAVEALNHGKVDLVLTGPAEYVIFQSRTPVKPVFGLVRPNYNSVFIVPAGSSITQLSELKNCKVGMGDVGSTSKHLAPMAMLADSGIDVESDIEVVHTAIRTGWEMLHRNQIDVFATTNDKFELLKKTDKEKPVTVIAESDQLPSDVLLAREDIDEQIVEALRAAIEKSGDSFVAALLKGSDNQKYQSMRFDTSLEDADYEIVRKMFRTAGITDFLGS